jgi:hypothetical protein
MTIKKLLAAIVGAVAFGLQTALSDNNFSTEELIGFIAMILTVVGTWIVPNTSVLQAAKTWLASLVIGAGVLVPQIADGWQTNADLWPVLIAVLTAAGVYVMPGAPLHPVVDGTVVSVKDEPYPGPGLA